MNQADFLLYGVGDVGPKRDDPESILALAAPTLKEADILFGQLEEPLSERGVPQRFSFPGRLAHPKNVRALTYAGFDVVAFANNTTLNQGEDAFFDTLEILKQNGIAVVGVGRNIDEARKPLIIEQKETKVAFLGYCSVLPKGCEARSDRSGSAPMRASTFYEQSDWQPGTPPTIISLANKEDLEAMKEDIRKVRPLVDVVIMSIHWGIHLVPSLIAMYQKEVAYAAIDAGVDLILGHHPHILKGLEVYKGKVIFYSLGNFAFDSPYKGPGIKDFYGLKPDPEYPTYFFPVDSRKTIIAKCLISNKKVEKVSFLPAMINKQGQPEVLPRSDKRSSEVVEYLDWCCRDQKLDVRLSWEGDEVVVGV